MIETKKRARKWVIRLVNPMMTGTQMKARKWATRLVNPFMTEIFFLKISPLLFVYF